MFYVCGRGTSKTWRKGYEGQGQGTVSPQWNMKHITSSCRSNGNIVSPLPSGACKACPANPFRRLPSMPYRDILENMHMACVYENQINCLTVNKWRWLRLRAMVNKVKWQLTIFFGWTIKAQQQWRQRVGTTSGNSRNNCHETMGQNALQEKCELVGDL